MVDVINANKARRALMRYVNAFDSMFSGPSDAKKPMFSLSTPTPRPAARGKEKPNIHSSLLERITNSISQTFSPSKDDLKDKRDPSPRKAGQKMGYLSSMSGSRSDEDEDVGLHLSSSSLASSFTESIIKSSENPLVNSSSWVGRVEEAHFIGCGADRLEDERGADTDTESIDPWEGDEVVGSALLSDEEVEKMRHRFKI